MRFDALLGNESIKQRLSAALEKNRLSHCFLISGPEGSGKRTLAKLLTAAMQCTHGGTKPCLTCAQCRKVLGGVHPDIITVDDPEKKTVPVKAVREACADLYVRPNEGARKIYIFPRAQDLNPQGQNALLKCIEEPPAYGVFLLLTTNAEALLPTIRSRCVELRLSPLPESVLTAELKRRFPTAEAQSIRSAAVRSGGYLGQAAALLQETADLLPQTVAFADAYVNGSAGALLRVLTPMERLKRDQLRPILQQWHTLIAAALTVQAKQPPMFPEAAKIADNRTAADLLAAADSLRTAMEYLEANVSPAHLCGALAVRLQASSFA